MDAKQWLMKLTGFALSCAVDGRGRCEEITNVKIDLLTHAFA